MINRRSLRIKAFKNLYAYESCKGANYLMALDMIDKEFSLDLNSMDIIDKDELDRKKILAIEDFDKFFDPNSEDESINVEVKKEVGEALEFVKKQNVADYTRLAKDLNEEATRVTKDHLLIISLLEELAFQNKKFEDEQTDISEILGEKSVVNTNLYNNKVLAKFKSDSTYNKLLSSFKINWANQEDKLGNWYRVISKKDDTFKEYIKKENPVYEEDWLILDYICRGVFFKNDVFTSYFEDIDLDWSENKPIIRSLVLKTLKSVKEEEDKVKIAEISYNWKDDSEYVKELFKVSVKENDKLEKLLIGKLQNWDIERVALTDRVLLKMALAELIHFPSIPTKVTINEFIEISKTFSTPKSKKFVNGILDGLSAELVKSGIIRKSGRGLLDNK